MVSLCDETLSDGTMCKLESRLGEGYFEKCWIFRLSVTRQPVVLVAFWIGSVLACTVARVQHNGLAVYTRKQVFTEFLFIETRLFFPLLCHNSF